MEWHLDMKKGETIPVIIPLVIYHSKTPWNYPTGIVSMFDEKQQDLAKKVLIEDFKLVNLNEIPDDEIIKHNWAGLLELSLKWAKERDIMLLLEQFKPLLIMACRDNQKVFFSTLNYLVDVGETDKDKLLEWSKHNLNDEGDTIVTVAEQWKEEGREESIKKTALNMLKKNMDIDTISEVTELPVDQIEELKAQNQDYFDEKK